MTGHEIVMLLLICLLPAVIGFFGGMIWMRQQYLPTIRWQRKYILKLERMKKALPAEQSWQGN